MNTRGIRVEAFAEPATKTKTLFPWRDPIKGPLLKTILVKHVLVSGIYLKNGTKGIDGLWDSLVPQVMKEPEFIDAMKPEMAQLTGRGFRDQFNKIIEERSNFHGWNGANVGNRSGKEGDLDEMDSNVRQMLMDLEERDTKKEKAELLKVDLDAKEQAIVRGEVQEQAAQSKKKRKEREPASGGTSSSSSDSSPADAFAFLDEFIFKPTARAKVEPAKQVESRLKKLLAHFFDGAHGGYEAWCAKMKAKRAELPAILEDIDEIIIVDKYCKMDEKDFEAAMISYGLLPLEATKVWHYLANIEKEKGKNAELTTPDA